MAINSKNKEQEFYQNSIRVLFILYFFTEDYQNPNKSDLVKVLYSEVRIQKIDFLLRYPSYLCDELMNIGDKTPQLKNEISNTVSYILGNNEPKLKTKEMQRFFFGAYDKLDEIISFLWSYGLIKFDSKRRTDMTQHQKEYYMTKYGVEKIESGLTKLPSLKWYVDRCKLINKYFGDLSGTELKQMQYEHPEYRDANWNEVIQDIETRVRKRFENHYKTQA